MLKEKLIKILLMIEIGWISFMPVTAHASGITTNKVTVNPNLNTNDLMGSIIGFVLGLFQFIGVIMLILGVAMFIMNSHEDQVDKRLKSVIIALGGAALIGLKAILTAIGVLA